MAELLELTLVQTYYNQQIINRFNYVASGTPASVSYSFALTWAFGAIADGGVYPATGICKLLAVLQSAQVSFTGVTTLNVYSDTDFYSTPFNPVLNGAITGQDGMSPTMAYGFRTSRVRRDIRRGQKRFVGATESSIGAGGTVDTAGANLVALKNALGATLTYDDEGNTLTFQPAVVKKQRYEVDDDPDRIAYRYIRPIDGGKDAQLLDTATGFSWEAYPQVRTQRSRQYGVGS